MNCNIRLPTLSLSLSVEGNTEGSRNECLINRCPVKEDIDAEKSQETFPRVQVDDVAKI
jgi:hypothetical protein